MAYRSFDPDAMSAILADAPRADDAVRTAPSPDFGRFETMAVWLGARDDPTTLRAGRFLRSIGHFFGLEPARRLTDPRLESLRRLTLALRRGVVSRLAAEKDMAREAGVSEAQIAALEARFAA